MAGRMMRAVAAFTNALKWEEPAPEPYTPSATSSHTPHSLVSLPDVAPICPLEGVRQRPQVGGACARTVYRPGGNPGAKRWFL